MSLAAPQGSPLVFTTRDGSAWEPLYVDQIDQDRCTRCGFCLKICPAGVFSLLADRRVIVGFHGACRGCAVCANHCKDRAILCRPLAELPPLEAGAK